MVTRAEFQLLIDIVKDLNKGISMHADNHGSSVKIVNEQIKCASELILERLQYLEQKG